MNGNSSPVVCACFSFRRNATGMSIEPSACITAPADQIELELVLVLVLANAKYRAREMVARGLRRAQSSRSRPAAFAPTDGRLKARIKAPVLSIEPKSLAQRYAEVREGILLISFRDKHLKTRIRRRASKLFDLHLCVPSRTFA